jgi:hypothetical protein
MKERLRNDEGLRDDRDVKSWLLREVFEPRIFMEPRREAREKWDVTTAGEA